MAFLGHVPAPCLCPHALVYEAKCLEPNHGFLMVTLARQISVAFMFQTGGSQAKEQSHGMVLVILWGPMCTSTY